MDSATTEGREWRVVRVMDADPNARAGSAEVKVKIAAPVQPVPPEPLVGTALRPVEFDPPKSHEKSPRGLPRSTPDPAPKSPISEPQDLSHVAH